MTDDGLSFSQRLIGFLPNLRRFAIALCRSRELADDLVQAACEKALAAEDSFQPGTRFDAWMFRILRNIWIDTLRRQKTAGVSEDISNHEDLGTPSGEEAAIARMTLQTVSEAIDLLPDEQREVLLMVCVEELSYKETTELLGIPIGTVMSRLARARKNLAERTGIDKDPMRLSPVKGGNQ